MLDQNHSLQENFLALIIGAALISLGYTFLNTVGLLAGGTLGLAIFLTKVFHTNRIF